MLTFRNLALRRGEHLLLADVDLMLPAGSRVGVVGRNGCGKSSLFAVIQGDLDPDLGEVELSGKVRIASVAQETPSLPDPAVDFVMSGDALVWEATRAERTAMAAEDYAAVADAHHRLAELQAYDAEARAARLLHGLGFPAETHQKAVAEFSGGWRVRLNVARALMTPSDLLLLDEPSNHLDLDAVLWLEQWLLKYPGTLLIISHDREFLDGVTSHTLHLHEQRAKLYTGNYTSFERQRCEHLRLQQMAFEKEQAEREHLQKFIARFKAKASKAKQAQSRMKRLAKLAGTEAVRAEHALHISFEAPAKLPFSLVRLDRVVAGYRAAAAAGRDAAEHLPAEPAPAGGDTVILRGIGFGLEAGDRVALLGPNGAGKSTLVKTLVGELPVLGGEYQTHSELRIGYFAQHTVESLREGETPMDHLRDIAPEASTQDMRSFLGRWYFPGQRVFQSVDVFSGGERARLALALIAWRKPNVLLLDEPTNHLDLDMREALAEALSDFDGAIVLVSHDRHLIGLVCDTFWRVADGKVEAFKGDLDEYATWLSARAGKSPAAISESRSPLVEAPPSRVSATPRGSPVGRVKGDTQRKRGLQQLALLEQRLQAQAEELAGLESRLAEPAVYGDSGEFRRLSERHAALRVDREAVEAEWLSVCERLEVRASTDQPARGPTGNRKSA